jgi:exopolyphosphatase / guanosine-5'-triphosphate,3'-diphosphate pyrophosphatase
MMRLASIDIGTNTILMLVADVERNGTLSVVRDEHIIARLGKGVDEHGFIQKETFQRVRRILSQLKSIADSNRVQHLAACGTSALRDAANRQEFIDFIREHLSIDIKILSGQEEAEATYLGAVSEYLEDSPSGEFAVLDIGGGSTELVSGTGSNVSSAASIDIGSVRLTERILKNSPPDTTVLENAVKLVQNHLHHISPLPSATTLIGVAGTLTTLAALDLQLKTFDKTLINRCVLTRETIERIFQELRHLTLDQIRSYPQIHASRADILLAGILILRETLHKVNVSQIIVSDRGLRYGILLQMARTLINA